MTKQHSVTDHRNVKLHAVEDRCALNGEGVGRYFNISLLIRVGHGIWEQNLKNSNMFARLCWVTWKQAEC